ncbi:MAG: hypothetical protein E6J53_10585 [Chloroflexi bacterium]|nr:MAG: hypothetical protein E6J53_10585 [Chloroflexota bacterium]
MDSGTLVTIAVVILAVVVLLLLIRAAIGGSRRAKLRDLSPSARQRYITEWDQIETRFIDTPEEAVRQAETIVMSVLRERGHPLSDRDLPSDMKRAHKLAYGSRDRTEGMRQAMLNYRGVMEKMVGPVERVAPERVAPEGAREREIEEERRRREMA